MEELEMALDIAPKKLNQVKGYKLKHKATGLYYRPTNGFMGSVERTPSLSKRGKVYKSRHRFPDWYRDLNGDKQPTSKYDWEVEVIYEEEKK